MPSGSIVAVIKKSRIGHSESNGTQNVKSLPEKPQSFITLLHSPLFYDALLYRL